MCPIWGTALNKINFKDSIAFVWGGHRHKSRRNIMNLYDLSWFIQFYPLKIHIYNHEELGFSRIKTHGISTSTHWWLHRTETHGNFQWDPCSSSFNLVGSLFWWHWLGETQCERPRNPRKIQFSDRWCRGNFRTPSPERLTQRWAGDHWDDLSMNLLWR